MNDDEAQRDPIETWLAATGGVTGTGAVQPPADADDREGGVKAGRRLLVLSVLPWLAVVVLAGAALDRPPAASTAPAATFPTPAGAPATESPPTAGHDTPPRPTMTAAHAAAVVALRAAAAADEYIDTAAVESTAPAGELTVVTVRAVRLRRTGDAWGDPHVIRAGVAVGVVDGEILAVAPPWRLPAPSSVAAPLPWEAVEDPQLRAAAAATAQAAGYTGISKAVVRRAGALPDVVSLSVTATAPGDDDAARHEILLTADATALLGASAAPPPVLPIPAEQP